MATEEIQCRYSDSRCFNKLSLAIVRNRTCSCRSNTTAITAGKVHTVDITINNSSIRRCHHLDNHSDDDLLAIQKGADENADKELQNQALLL